MIPGRRQYHLKWRSTEDMAVGGGVCAFRESLFLREGLSDLDLAALRDRDLLLRGCAVECFDRLDHVKPLEDRSKNDVLAVEPRSRNGANEELRSVGARTGVCHRERARTGVLELEVLVFELGAVDRLTAGAVALGEVAALDPANQYREREGERERDVPSLRALSRISTISLPI